MSLRSRLEERQIPMPEDAEAIMSVIRKLLAMPDFHSVHIEVGRPITIMRSVDPMDIVEGVSRTPQGLLATVSLVPVQLDVAPGPIQLMQIMRQISRSNLSCRAVLAQSVGVVSRWLSIEPSVLQTQIWDTLKSDFQLFGIPGYTEEKLGENIVAFLAGETDAFTTLNIKKGYYAYVESIVHDKKNTGGWRFS